jgi:hypothetical protein
MARSAAHIRSLARACELVHDRAFNSRRYPVPLVVPLERPTTPSTSPAKSRKEWLEERFQQAVRRELARMGIE